MNNQSDSPRLVLASRSYSRAALLRKAGIKFSVRVSDIDEQTFVTERKITGPGQIARTLARAKAEAVSMLIGKTRELSFVLGCDSVFEFDGDAYGKPLEETTARERIQAIQGHSGILHTGHWLEDTATGAGKGAVSSATVHFDTMNEREIDAYVSSREPLQAAGAFTIDGIGSNFVKSIEGSATAVAGLDINVLRKLFNEFGVDVMNLWG